MPAGVLSSQAAATLQPRMALSHEQLESPASASRLALSRTGGPLVAVVGLSGGTGASTVAHLLAAAAVRGSAVPVLIADTGGPSSSLNLHAGVSSSASLPELARQIEAERRPAGAAFAVGVDGLRVISTGPEFGRRAADDVLERVLDDARAAHGAVVVDCGSLARDADLVVLRSASHVVWVGLATRLGMERASGVLDALNFEPPGRETLVVRRAASDEAVPLPLLTELADRRHADLLLFPHVKSIDELPLTERLERVAVALDALAGVLR